MSSRPWVICLIWQAECLEANIYMSGPQTSGMAGGTKPIHAEK